MTTPARLALPLALALALALAAVSAPAQAMGPGGLATGGGPNAWTGPYVGIDGGYAWGRSGAEPGSYYTLDGGFGGLDAGYNFQLDQFVLGVEGDIAAGTIGGTFTAADGTPSPEDRFTVNALATVRGRAGIVFGTVLLYGTAGMAFAEGAGNYREGDITNSVINTGYAVGAGIEAKLDRNWSIKGEYLYTGFGDRDYHYPVLGETFSYDLHLQTARVGLNYAF